MSKFNVGVLATLFCISGVGALASSNAIIIGGGNTLENSQGQIEENVQWVSEILRNRQIETQVYFTHGSDTDLDIVYFDEARLSDTPENTLRRIYLKSLDFAKSYKRNSLNGVKGPTSKAELTTSVREGLAKLNDQAEALVIFNGHGDIDFTNTDNNSLKLWHDQRLSIKEIENLFAQAPKQSTIRFIFTQCFSGSFAKLAFENLEVGKLASPRSCGFMAESDRREAEGCDLGINPSEFRDYTTYFFAALHGRTRTGQTIDIEKTDLNASGTVDFREAHLYTLANAFSGDLSRSTSEQYVEYEEPWYRRWDTAFAPEQNVYRDIATQVAERERIPAGGFSLLRQILQERARLQQLQADQDAAHHKIAALQATLRTELGQTDLAALATEQQNDLYRNAIESPSFQKLKSAQDELMQLNEVVLQQTRKYTQRLKTARMNRISRLAHYQSNDPVYQSLVDCESSGQL